MTVPDLSVTRVALSHDDENMKAGYASQQTLHLGNDASEVRSREAVIPWREKRQGTTQTQRRRMA